MTYAQTIEFLFSQLPAYHRIGKAAYKNDLNNTALLDDYFGHPHKKFHTIHIAGTNGKGSVSHMIASVLQEAGYKTGLYTSPHLKDFRERIKVNGEMIPEDDVVKFVSVNTVLINTLKPSFFELTVAMAFNHFAECSVDVAVIEVGLGGRLDSTNIIHPLLSLITNIGHDHMDLLGDNFKKIAYEKGGIIKEKTPVVISETQPETKDVFVLKAAESDAPIVFADDRYNCTLGEIQGFDGTRKYTVTNRISNQFYEGETVLGGDYQARNIKAVYSAVDLLKNKFFVTDENISAGIKKVVINTGLKGRWQILSHNPLTICDTGHNKEGLEYVVNQILGMHITRMHMVLGFVNDKDLKSVLPIFPKQAEYYFTKAAVPRALDQETLRLEAAKYGLFGKSYPDVKTAMSGAQQNAAPSDLIFIGGSTFIVAEVV